MTLHSHYMNTFAFELRKDSCIFCYLTNNNFVTLQPGMSPDMHSPPSRWAALGGPEALVEKLCRVRVSNMKGKQLQLSAVYSHTTQLISSHETETWSNMHFT